MAEEDKYLYALDVELSLAEYVQTYSLPQLVKVTDGYCDSEAEFSNGDVVQLVERKCESVSLTCFSVLNTEERTHVMLPLDCLASFNVIPMGRNKPYCPSPKPSLLKFKGVSQLAEFCPLYVQVLHTYQDPGRLIISKGERLRLLRFVRRCGVKYLECKCIKKDQLVYLSISDTSGEFQEIRANHYYTLPMLVETLPHDRRLQLSEDVVNQRPPMSELPCGENMVILMQRPQWMVVVSPVGSPGSRYTIPGDTDITISPRQDTYASKVDIGIALKTFARDNATTLPAIATITDWDEESTVLENHHVQPGMSLVLHNETEIYKYATRTLDDQYFCIPEDYKAPLRLIPRIFNNVNEIDKKLNFTFVALTDISIVSDERKDVSHGDAFKVIKVNRDKGTATSLLCAVLDGPKLAPTANEISFPVDLNGTFEEIICGDNNSLVLSHLRHMDRNFPIALEFTAYSTSIPQHGDPVPRNVQLLLDYMLAEECVMVTKELERTSARGFNLPLRTGIYLKHTEAELDKRPPQRKSDFDACPEKISKSTFEDLVNYRVDYEEILGPPPALPPSVPIYQHKPVQVKPALPKATGRSQSESALCPVLPPRDDQKPRFVHSVSVGHRPPPLPPKSKTDHSKQSNTNFLTKLTQSMRKRRPSGTKSPERSISPGISVPPFGPRALPERPPSPKADEIDYEPVDGLGDSATTTAPVTIQLPDDANLYNFNVDEMVSFLGMNNVDGGTIRRWKAAAIDGERFAAMSDDELRSYGILSHPIAMHFKKNTKPVKVDIPKSGNLFSFTVEEMTIFLRDTLKVHGHIIERWRKARIDGQQFSKMTDKELKDFDLASNTILKYFRKHTKPAALCLL